jgi:hypothetical protein
LGARCSCADARTLSPGRPRRFHSNGPTPRPYFGFSPAREAAVVPCPPHDPKLEGTGRLSGAFSVILLLRLVLAPTTRSGMMTSSAETCWRLSRDCGQWAAESRDSAARLAFRQMARAWARVAFSEEFTPAVDERIDPPSSESSEPTPAEKQASSLLMPPSENAEPEVNSSRDWRTARERLSLPLPTLFPKLWGKPGLRRAVKI